VKKIPLLDRKALHPGLDHGFDISPDGREVVLEREQDLADVVLLDLPRP
jgi:hypothetical protein